MHFIDKSSTATVESRNETYSLKLQCYGQTDCFQLPSKQIIDFVHIQICKETFKYTSSDIRTPSNIQQ